MTENDFPSTTPLMLIGIVLVIAGVLAIATPAVAGQAVVMIIGGVLLLIGIFQIVSGIRAESLKSKLSPLVLGAITALCGLGLLGEPWIGMKIIALYLAIFFVVEGVWKIFTSFSYRPASGWLYFLGSGVMAIVLGLLIWKQWPISGLWAVGIFVGVDLLATGISMIVVATTIRKLKNLVVEPIES